MSVKLIRSLIAVVALIVLVAYQHFTSTQGDAKLGNDSRTNAIEQTDQTALLNKIRNASEDTNSRFWLTIDAKVSKKLKDDLKGSKHQRFLIRPAKDISLLIAHNIDLADYVPLDVGDPIKIRGRYEWNHKGGVIHWTHHDPRGKKEGGWIYHNGKYYK